MSYFDDFSIKSNPVECIIKSLSLASIKIQTIKLLVRRYIYAEIVRPRRQGDLL